MNISSELVNQRKESFNISVSINEKMQIGFSFS